MKSIHKAGAIILNAQGQVLAVHKRGKPENEFIVPGGVLEKEETHEMALHREIREELGVEIASFHFYADFEAKAIYDDCWLYMKTFLVVLKDAPKPNNEIDQLVWLDKNFNDAGYVFASILGKQLLPRLLSEGLLL